MIYERWPDEDSSFELLDDRWPDCDPDIQSGTSIHAFVEAMTKAFGVARDGIAAAFSPYRIIVPGKVYGKLKSAGYGDLIMPYDEFGLAPPVRPIEEILDGYKTLKNGRKMPVVPRNTGPRRDPLKKRGMTR